MKEPVYICLYVPDFATQVLLRMRPELRKSPVVVLEAEPPFQHVCSANDTALQLGVSPGMTRAELDSFSGLVQLRRSMAEESTARAVLLEVAGRFTPRVEVWAASASKFVMVLDMTGTELIFGSTQQALEVIARVLDGIVVRARLAASANFHTAVCLAPTASKTPILVRSGFEAECLKPLRLSFLSLTPEQMDTMELWGLRTFGELAVLPEVELIARLGQEGKRLRLLTRGEHPHLMIPEEPVFTLEELVVFDEPVESMESLLFVLGPMVDQLLARAQNRSMALASLTVRLGLDGGAEHERTIKPALPVLQRDVLLRLLHLDLQSHPPSAGVLSIHVHAEPGDRSKVQLGLFSPQLPEPLRLDVTLARIAAIVGEDRVGSARLQDTHSPEGFVMERFFVPLSVPQERTAEIALARRRFRPPIAVSVTQEDGCLRSLMLQGKRYAVQSAYGPWRRSSAWWSSGVRSCEEWDVTAKSVSPGDTLICLVSYDMLHHRWLLEALYD